METFRCKQPLIVALLCMAFAAMASGQGQARLEHVTPRRDFVGPHPTKLEWTAVAGAESYAITVENEIEIPMLEQENITTTSMPWPKSVHLDPGTYFWRIIAIKGNRILADSGRAAFLVRE